MKYSVTTNYTHYNKNNKSLSASPLRLTSSALAVSLLWLSSPAAAQDECGAPVSGVVTCATQDPVNFPDGITYTTSGGLVVNVGNNLLIAPNPGNVGVDVSTDGPDPVTVNIDPGVYISTSGSQADAVRLFSSGTSDVTVNYNGNMTGSFTVNDAPQSPTTAAFVGVVNATSTANSLATQGIDSTVIILGPEAVGFYALQEGLGNATTQANGTITVAGDMVYGLLSYVKNTASDGSVLAIQSQTSTISAGGELAAGVYGLNEGTGASTVDVAGRIIALGDDSNASLVFSNNSDATGLVTHIVRNTAQLSLDTQDLGGKVIMTLTSGINATSTSIAGTVTGLSDNTVGAYVNAFNVDNNSQHILSLTGSGQITTDGENSHGVLFKTLGTGAAIVTLNNSSSIAARGNNANGILMDVGGTSTITTAAATSVTSIGLGANAISSRSVEYNLTTVNGAVSSTGRDSAGIYNISAEDRTDINVAATSNVIGGWDTGAALPATDPFNVATAIAIQSDLGSKVTNNGTLSSGADRAVFDLGRLNGVVSGPLTIANNRLITGYVQYASATGNRFENAASASFVTRHFADNDGNGTRDIKRVAISDFGHSSSVFANAGLVSLGAIPTATSTNNTGYYVPQTGLNGRALETSVYDLARPGIVQAIFTNLGRFEHSGVLDLRGSAIGNSLVMTSNPAAGGTAGTGLFVANGGQLLLNAVLNTGIPNGGQTGNQSDMLIVDGTLLGSGATQIFVDVSASSLGGYTPGNGIQLVEVRNKSLSADNVFTLGAPVAAGAFDYGLFHHGVGGDTADGNWYLRSSIADPDTGEEFPRYRNEVPVLTVIPALAQRLGLDMLGNYHDRQGEDYADWLPRSAAQSGVPSDGHNGRKTAMWARVFGSDGKTDYRRSTVTQQGQGFARYGAAYDYETIAFQMGYDLLRATNDSGTRNIAGLYGGIGEVEARVDSVYGNGASGRVKVDGYNLGLYFTHKRANGTYIDAVLQATRYKSHAWNYSGDQVRTKGWGYAASLEAGVPFTISEGWRLEPQAQIVYQRVKMDDVADSFAVYDYRSGDALWGRLGLRMTNQWTRQSGLSNMAWARFNVWHDFDRDSETRVSNLGGQNVTPLLTSLGGTWGQGQLAFSSEMARNVSGFISGDYSFSLDRLKSDAYGGRIGLKFVW